MNRKVFVDSSVFFALIDGSNAGVVLDVMKKCHENGTMLATTDYVLDEMITLLRCRERYPVEKILEFMQSLYVSDIEILGITEDTFGNALRLMRKYKDHYFSFTDCVSFVVMDELKTPDVLTFDRDFTIAGFNNLMESV